jgi:SAM-dependent methyltransferase
VSGASPEPSSPPAEQYGESYFAHQLGEPYTRESPTWRAFFGRVADFIVEEFAPTTVLDVGCAIGFLVEALRERGVDARGIDISEYAISQVPESLKPYCTVASATDELDGDYDVITCIEVLEHLPPELAKEAIDNLTRHTDRIVFSSTPYDTRETTHVNVRQPDDWVRLFAERGFLPVPTSGTLAISPQAMVLERDGPVELDRIAAYERARCDLAKRLSDDAQRLSDASKELEARRRTVRELERRTGAAELDARRQKAQAAQLEVELDEVRSTTWWRWGAPVRASVTFLLRALGPRTSRVEPSSRKAAPPGVRGWALMAGRRLPPSARRLLAARFPGTVERLVRTDGASPPVDELVGQRLPLLRPLSVFPVPTDGRTHLTILTDSLGGGSLFGGVATSLILSAMLARRLGASLRVVTRLERPDPSNFALVLRSHEIEWDGDVEFAFSPIDGRSSFPWRAGEVFLTTSWWSTWSALRSVDPKRVLYLLQEDERLFYPAGDEQILCGEVLADPRIRFAVNTAMLHEHLVAEGFENIAANGVSFEPAFPESIYYRDTWRRAAHRRFFFYARPNNARNLFLRGLEAVEDSLVRGILDADEWELHFVGPGVPDVSLPSGARPRTSEQLPLPEYGALLRSVDVGLSLMTSPHPSYPPLDLAACGAVAVTSRFGPKQSLDRYSDNIICTDLRRDSIVEGIAAAATLAADEEQRRLNYESQRLSRSWASSLGQLVEELVQGL